VSLPPELATPVGLTRGSGHVGLGQQNSKIQPFSHVFQIFEFMQSLFSIWHEPLLLLLLPKHSFLRQSGRQRDIVSWHGWLKSSRSKWLFVVAARAGLQWESLVELQRSVCHWYQMLLPSFHTFYDVSCKVQYPTEPWISLPTRQFIVLDIWSARPAALRVIRAIDKL